MGTVKSIADVTLICGICTQNEEQIKCVLDTICQSLGPVQRSSRPFAFEHTDYYAVEMGRSLIKLFVSFANHIDPVRLPDLKLYTNAIEQRFADQGKRTVNLDPGYIEIPKLVLATTKNFSHRIYLGKGIFGDVQLYWRQGKFIGYPWTYPDYLEPENCEFFTAVRNQLILR
jgi:hypothetical protein